MRPHGAKGHGFDVESLVGFTLLAGVLLSLGLIAVGLAWHWVIHGTIGLDYLLPATSVADFITVEAQQLVSAAARPRLLVNTGIAVLLLTPYVRVLVSMLYFLFIERNLKYSLFTGFVLGTLTYSLFGGRP